MVTITKRFNLDNDQQAAAIYLYLKYIGEEFLVMKDLEGTMEKTALYNFFSEHYEQYLDNAIQFMQENIIK